MAKYQDPATGLTSEVVTLRDVGRSAPRSPDGLLLAPDHDGRWLLTRRANGTVVGWLPVRGPKLEALARDIERLAELRKD